MKSRYVLTGALLIIGLTACSGPTVVASAQSPAASSQALTPTPTPTPTAMTVDEAGKFYLGVICKSNKTAAALNATAQVLPFDLAASVRDAALERDAIKMSIQQLSAPSRPWPTAVTQDVDAFVEGLYGELSNAASLAASNTKEGFIETWNAYTDPKTPSPAHVASQKIRLKLGLSADAVGSCGL